MVASHESWVRSRGWVKIEQRFAQQVWSTCHSKRVSGRGHPWQDTLPMVAETEIPRRSPAPPPLWTTAAPPGWSTAALTPFLWAMFFPCVNTVKAIHRKCINGFYKTVCSIPRMWNPKASHSQVISFPIRVERNREVRSIFLQPLSPCFKTRFDRDPAPTQPAKATLHNSACQYYDLHCALCIPLHALHSLGLLPFARLNMQCKLL